MNQQSESIQKIGQRLLNERIKLKFTQKKMAESLGTSAQWYGQVERGHSRPSIEMLAALYEKHNIDLTYIIVGEPLIGANLDKIVVDCPEDKQYLIETIVRAAKELYSDNKNK